jgi:hypothetical protein
MSAQASKVERFPVTHWRAAEREDKQTRPLMPADDLSHWTVGVAQACVLVALLDEVCRLGGERGPILRAAVNMIEALGIDPDAAGVEKLLKKLVGTDG